MWRKKGEVGGGREQERSIYRRSKRRRGREGEGKR